MELFSEVKVYEECKAKRGPFLSIGKGNLKNMCIFEQDPIDM